MLSIPGVGVTEASIYWFLCVGMLWPWSLEGINSYLRKRYYWPVADPQMGPICFECYSQWDHRKILKPSCPLLDIEPHSLKTLNMAPTCWIIKSCSSSYDKLINCWVDLLVVEFTLMVTNRPERYGTINQCSHQCAKEDTDHIMIKTRQRFVVN